MARLLEFSPYILAAATIAFAGFALVKDWDDYKHSWLKVGVLVAMCIISILTFVSLYQDNADKQSQRNTARKLEGQVEAANKAQTNNTALFLNSFKDLSQQVTELQTQVKTDALQKKLARVQAELQSTEKALAPKPKTYLSFSFNPVSYSPDGKHTLPSTEITLPVSGDGVIHVPFNIMNTTYIDALEGTVNLVICDDCKFVKDPEGFTRLTHQPETQRSMPFERILAKSTVGETVDISVPEGFANVLMGIQFRCTTCVVTAETSSGTVHLKRDFVKRN